MVQKDESWRWLLKGFRYELEAQVRPRTVEYYCDHARAFVRWVERAAIIEPRLLTKRDINSFFHYITNTATTLNEVVVRVRKLGVLSQFDITTIVGSSGY